VGTKGSWDTLKYKSDIPKSKFAQSSVKMRQVDIDFCYHVDKTEYDHGSISFPQEFQSQSTEQDSGSSIDGSEESSLLMEDPSLNENEEVETDITTARNRLKLLADMIR
jgi:hypothetical protein